MKKQECSSECTINIGNKPTMNYVLAAYTQAALGCKEIVFRSRGNSNNRMMNAVEVHTRLLCPKWSIKKIEAFREDLGGSASVMALHVTIALESSPR